MTIDRVPDATVTASASSSPASVPASVLALPGADGQSSADARRIAGLASEFEAMLLGQMLREMRQAGSWKDESEGDSLGSQPLFDAIDAELALRLAKAQPLGLGDQLVREITRGPQAGRTVAPAADGSVVTSGFGWRQDPLTGVPAFHKGIDVRATYGDAVTAAGSGRVVVAQSQGGYGQTVVVDHGGGRQTRYAHLSAVGVQVGDTVAAGDPVGRAGRSGRATGTHVHFEATQGGEPVDPAELSARLKAEPLLADVRTGRTDSWRRP